MTRIVGLALGMVLGLSPGVALAADDPWPGLQADAFASRPMTADSALNIVFSASPGCTQVTVR